MLTMNEQLTALQLIAEVRGEVFYQLLCRRAGWAVEWYLPATNETRVYAYHPDPESAVTAELVRLQDVPLVETINAPTPH